MPTTMPLEPHLMLTRMQTLMGTDIFQSDYQGTDTPKPYAHLGPLSIYLALSLPLTVGTLLFWLAFHYWETRSEKLKQNKQIAKYCEP